MHWIVPIKNEVINRLTLTLAEVVKVKIQQNFPHFFFSKMIENIRHDVKVVISSFHLNFYSAGAHSQTRK